MNLSKEALFSSTPKSVSASEAPSTGLGMGMVLVNCVDPVAPFSSMSVGKEEGPSEEAAPTL